MEEEFKDLFDFNLGGDKVIEGEAARLLTRGDEDSLLGGLLPTGTVSSTVLIRNDEDGLLDFFRFSTLVVYSSDDAATAHTVSFGVEGALRGLLRPFVFPVLVE